MAVKESYSIPSDINVSQTDIKIPIRFDSGFGVRPISLKTVFVACGMIVGLIWVLTSTFVGRAPGWAVALFVVGWVALGVMAVTRTRLGESRLSQAMSLVEYGTRASRRLVCRTSSRDCAFSRVMPVESVGPDGLITYTDGAIGRAYLVVGCASNFLFDRDRDRILDAVDRWWRKSERECEYQVVCTKEPQQVRRQVLSLAERSRAVGDDPELQALLDVELQTLRDLHDKGYQSIHQYLFLRCPNREVLARVEATIADEVASRGLVFKVAERLGPREVARVLSRTYRG